MRTVLLCLLVALLLCACRSDAPRPAPALDAALDHDAAPAHDGPALPVFQFLCTKYDADQDGRITRGEYTRSERGFGRLDADRDGTLTAADFDARFDGQPRLEGEFVYGEGGPELGEPAPDFTLPTTAGTTLALSSFRAQKPVALIFGSFT